MSCLVFSIPFQVRIIACLSPFILFFFYPLSSSFLHFSPSPSLYFCLFFYSLSYYRPLFFVSICFSFLSYFSLTFYDPSLFLLPLFLISLFTDLLSLTLLSFLSWDLFSFSHVFFKSLSLSYSYLYVLRMCYNIF